MVTMSVTSRGPMTRVELDALPDDGRRHELIDGVLVVTPAPLVRHQVAVAALLSLLRRDCPGDLIVLSAPVDVVVAPDTVVQPDLLVARRADLTEKDLPASPLLAVEVLSPSTRRVDLNLKRARYEAAGWPSYWVFDPDGTELTAWELEGGAYGPATVVRGGETYRTDRPFPVSVTPTDLTS